MQMELGYAGRHRVSSCSTYGLYNSKDFHKTTSYYRFGQLWQFFWQMAVSISRNEAFLQISQSHHVASGGKEENLEK